VDLGVGAEVEADRLEGDERGAGRVDVGGGELRLLSAGLIR
jgi:hypothetical protein